MDEGAIEADHLGDGEMLDRLDARLAKALRAAGGLRMRIGLAVDDSRDAGGDQRLAARPGAALMVAGLEGHEDRAAGGAFTGHRQSLDLGVRPADPAVVSESDDPPGGIDDHATDRGIGFNEPMPAYREAHGHAKEFGVAVVLGLAHGRGAFRRAGGAGHHRPRRGGESSDDAPETHDAGPEAGVAEGLELGTRLSPW
jgi:hypothetical protein